jgi:hypothetical protein
MTIEQLLEEIKKEQHNISVYEQFLDKKLTNIQLYFNDESSITIDSNVDDFDKFSKTIISIFVQELRNSNVKLKHLLDKKKKIEELLRE